MKKRISTRAMIGEVLTSPKLARTQTLRDLLEKGVHKRLCFSLKSFHLALRLGCEPEDLFQLSALYLLNAESKYPFDSSKSKLTTWVCMVMNCALCKEIRRRTRKFELPSLAASPEALGFVKGEAPFSEGDLGELRKLAEADPSLSWHAKDHILSLLSGGERDFEAPAFAPSGRAMKERKQVFTQAKAQARLWIQAHAQA